MNARDDRASPLSGWLAALATSHPRRVLTVVGGLLIAILIGAAGATTWTAREKTIEGTERELSRLSVTLAEQTARALQSADLILAGLQERFATEGIVSADEFRRYLATEDVYHQLRDKIRDTPQIDALSLIDRDGNVINFTRSWPTPKINVADREYFVAHRDHPDLGPTISEPVQNRGTGTWTIYVVRRVSDTEGNFVGLTLAAMESRYFEDFYRSVVPDQGGTIQLFRSDATLLARYPASEAPIGTKFPQFALLRDVLTRVDHGVLRVPQSVIDGRPRIIAGHVVRNYPLVVSVSAAEDEVLAGWWYQIYATVIIAASAIALIVLSGLLVDRLFAMQLSITASYAARERADNARAVAEAASRAKSGFLANMSHELRTPLNAIIGFTEMLAGRYFGPLNDKQAEYIGDIAASSRHLLGLISAVLDMSKIEAGRFELSEEAIDIPALFDEGINFLRIRAKENDLLLRKEVPDDLPRVRADRRALLQVVLNLLTNAVNFTDPGGRITAAAGVAADGTFAITVADTGVGISPADLARLFEPFQQSDARVSRKRGGSGLGLSISRMLVEQHGGTLQVASRPGEGTTVTVVLPAHRVIGRPPGGGQVVPLRAVG